MLITKKLISIATFDIFNTEWLEDEIWVFPEDEAFSLNFDTVGFGSVHFQKNAGFVFYIILAVFALALLHLFLYPCRNLSTVTNKIVAKMAAYLYFRGFLRLFMESFFDLLLISSLSLHLSLIHI